MRHLYFSLHLHGGFNDTILTNWYTTNKNKMLTTLFIQQKTQHLHDTRKNVLYLLMIYFTLKFVIRDYMHRGVFL